MRVLINNGTVVSNDIVSVCAGVYTLDNTIVAITLKKPCYFMTNGSVTFADTGMAFLDGLSYNVLGINGCTFTVLVDGSVGAFGATPTTGTVSGLGAIDYTHYVVDQSLNITDSINVPTLTTFSVCNVDAVFQVPRQNGYVSLVSEKFYDSGNGLNGNVVYVSTILIPGAVVVQLENDCPFTVGDIVTFKAMQQATWLKGQRVLVTVVGSGVSSNLFAFQLAGAPAGWDSADSGVVIEAGAPIVIASGFITNAVTMQYQGLAPSPGVTSSGGYTSAFGSYVGNVQVSSDEWLLNVKSVPFIPAFIGQTQGQILTTLANVLAPGVFDTSNIQPGVVVPYYQYDPTQSWSDVAKTFGDANRYHYKALNRKLYYLPLDDASLNVSYDDTQPDYKFDPTQLNSTVSTVPPCNDAIVLGAVEPSTLWEDNFVGDGITTNYPFRHKTFHAASAVLLTDDWTEQTISTSTWTIVENGTITDVGAIFVLAGQLNVINSNSTSGNAYGNSYLMLQNAVELGGAINLQHGQFQFNDYTNGLFGCICSTNQFPLKSDVIAGFEVTSPVLAVTGMIVGRRSPLFGQTWLYIQGGLPSTWSVGVPVTVNGTGFVALDGRTFSISSTAGGDQIRLNVSTSHAITEVPCSGTVTSYGALSVTGSQIIGPLCPVGGGTVKAFQRPRLLPTFAQFGDPSTGTIQDDVYVSNATAPYVGHALLSHIIAHSGNLLDARTSIYNSPWTDWLVVPSDNNTINNWLMYYDQYEATGSPFVEVTSSPVNGGGLIYYTPITMPVSAPYNVSGINRFTYVPSVNGLFGQADDNFLLLMADGTATQLWTAAWNASATNVLGVCMGATYADSVTGVNSDVYALLYNSSTETYKLYRYVFNSLDGVTLHAVNINGPYDVTSYLQDAVNPGTAVGRCLLCFYDTTSVGVIVWRATFDSTQESFYNFAAANGTLQAGPLVRNTVQQVTNMLAGAVPQGIDANGLFGWYDVASESMQLINAAALAVVAVVPLANFAVTLGLDIVNYPEPTMWVWDEQYVWVAGADGYLYRITQNAPVFIDTGVSVTSSGASGLLIQPVFNGQNVGSPVVTKVNCNYILQTSINNRVFNRYTQIYTTLGGSIFGGIDINAPCTITLTITEVNVGAQILVQEGLNLFPGFPLAPLQDVVSSVTLDNVTVPTYAAYCLANVKNSNVTIESTLLYQVPQAQLNVRSLVGPTGLQLPVQPQNLGTEQHYTLGFGLANQTATIGQGNGDVDLLQFYDDDHPGVGARIRCTTWEASTAIGRVRDPDSIARTGIIPGDDGVRLSIFTTLTPPPRTSAECEMAAAAAITDREAVQYQGAYTVMDYFWTPSAVIDVTVVAATGVITGRRSPSAGRTYLYFGGGLPASWALGTPVTINGTGIPQLDGNTFPIAAIDSGTNPQIELLVDTGYALFEVPLSGNATTSDTVTSSQQTGYGTLAIGSQLTDLIPYPVTGRMLSVNSPPRAMPNVDLLVSSITTTVLELRGEILQFSIQFGTDQFLEKLLPNFLERTDSLLLPSEATIQPDYVYVSQLATSGAYAPDLTSPKLSICVGANAILDMGVIPVSASVEIRTTDFGWGTYNQNFVALIPGGQNTVILPRYAYDQTWYMRMRINVGAQVTVTGAIAFCTPTPPTSYGTLVVNPLVGNPNLVVGQAVNVSGFYYDADNVVPCIVTAPVIVVYPGGSFGIANPQLPADPSDYISGGAGGVFSYQSPPSVDGPFQYSRFSKAIRVYAPVPPYAPGITSFDPTNLNAPVITFNYGGNDIRNVYGVEVRGPDNITVLATNPIVSPQDLVVTMPSVSGVGITGGLIGRTFNYYPYFFNTLYDYSPAGLFQQAVTPPTVNVTLDVSGNLVASLLTGFATGVSYQVSSTSGFDAADIAYSQYQTAQLTQQGQSVSFLVPGQYLSSPYYFRAIASDGLPNTVPSNVLYHSGYVVQPLNSFTSANISVSVSVQRYPIGYNPITHQTLYGYIDIYTIFVFGMTTTEPQPHTFEVQMWNSSYTTLLSDWIGSTATFTVPAPAGLDVNIKARVVSTLINGDTSAWSNWVNVT